MRCHLFSFIRQIQLGLNPIKVKGFKLGPNIFLDELFYKNAKAKV